MRKREIDAAVSAAYPPSPEKIELMPLDAAEQDLIAAIVAEPHEDPLVADAGSASSGRAATVPAHSSVSAWRARTSRRLAISLTTAVAAVVVFLVAIVSISGPTGAPAPAFGAPLLRMAKASPLVLLDAPGWHVSYATDGSVVRGGSARRGEMRFFYDGPPEGPTGPGKGALASGQRGAELRWHAGRVTERALRHLGYPRLLASGSAAVLQTDRHFVLFRVKGPRGNRDVTAIWEDHRRMLAFRSTVPDLPTFKHRLAALRRVGTTDWLSALPPSVVKAANGNDGSSR